MLIDVYTAQEWLRTTHEDAGFIQILIDQASQIVVDYIKRPDHGWTPETVPPHVQAAVMHVLLRLYDDRQGELPGGPLPQHVKDLLWRERDPALA